MFTLSRNKIYTTINSVNCQHQSVIFPKYFFQTAPKYFTSASPSMPPSKGRQLWPLGVQEGP